MRPARPTDASGDGFRKALVFIRTIRPRDLVPLGRDEAEVIWDEEAMPPNCPAVREATAVLGDYVVEMRDSFLEGEPDLRMPKINWALQQPGDDGYALTGAPAPTFEEAKIRAEVAIRVFLGQTLDS